LSFSCLWSPRSFPRVTFPLWLILMQLLHSGPIHRLIQGVRPYCCRCTIVFLLSLESASFPQCHVPTVAQVRKRVV
jgi:hypothetical protein